MARKRRTAALPYVEVRELELADLLGQRAAYNPRTMSEHDATALEESIREFGLVEPIVWNRRTRRVVGGHQRLAALERLGAERVAVSVVDLDEQRERVLNVKLNRIAGDWDWPKLSALVGELEESARGDLGFTEDEIKAIERDGHALEIEARDARRQLSMFRAGSADDSVEPENEEPIDDLPPVVVARTGDHWKLGDHLLVCGDSTSAKTLERALQGDQVALVVTSPPYNQKLNTFKPSGKHAETPGWVHRLAAAYFDEVEEPEYRRRQIEQFAMLRGFMAPDGAVFYNHKVRYRDKQALHPIEWIRRFPFRIRQEIVWDRGGSVTLNARMFMPSDERIYWLTVSEDFIFNDETEIKSFATVWRIPPRNDVSISAPFPRELPTRCIRAASKPGDLVLDPYAGSGTVLMACADLERRHVGIEVWPAYVDAAIRRYERDDGARAVLVAEGSDSTASDPRPLDDVARDRAAAP